MRILLLLGALCLFAPVCFADPQCQSDLDYCNGQLDECEIAIVPDCQCHCEPCHDGTVPVQYRQCITRGDGTLKCGRRLLVPVQ